VTRVRETDTFTTQPAGMLEQKCRRHYDPVKQAGLPIGVQVCHTIHPPVMCLCHSCYT
jgi:hypothetical protein